MPRCPHIDRGDPRCFPSRVTSLLVDELIYYCGGHFQRCPHFDSLQADEADARVGGSECGLTQSTSPPKDAAA